MTSLQYAENSYGQKKTYTSVNVQIAVGRRSLLAYNTMRAYATTNQLSAHSVHFSPVVGLRSSSIMIMAIKTILKCNR